MHPTKTNNMQLNIIKDEKYDISSVIHEKEVQSNTPQNDKLFRSLMGIFQLKSHLQKHKLIPHLVKTISS